MNQDRQNQINRIIQQKYNQSQKSLDLTIIVQTEECSDIWAHVLRSRDWSMLKIINLFNCEINDDNLEIFINFNWPELTILRLELNEITGKGIQKFVAKQWPKLRTLKFGKNKIEDEGLHTLLKNFPKQLQDLDINECEITNKGVQMMVNYNISNLRKLFINFNKIGNSGIKWLTKCHLINLECLFIGDHKTGEEGHKHLRKGKWPLLRTCWWSYQCQNKMFLNSWQILYENYLEKLQQLQILVTQPICSLSLVLIKSKTIKMNESFSIQNRQLNETITEIMENRSLIIEQSLE